MSLEQVHGVPGALAVNSQALSPSPRGLVSRSGWSIFHKHPREHQAVPRATMGRVDWTVTPMARLGNSSSHNIDVGGRG